MHSTLNTEAAADRQSIRLNVDELTSARVNSAAAGRNQYFNLGTVPKEFVSGATKHDFGNVSKRPEFL